ncbi:integrase core domain-containing protein [Streptomyces mutabilis]|uniref:integrase core domain-containing protein n=1 Tax=Streptomyces mutabilis TaxID=67332 RepID=UPI003A4C597F
MSAVGSSADNALAESFNATFQRETPQGRKNWPGEREARLDALLRLHRCNTRRRHSRLGQRSPSRTPSTPFAAGEIIISSTPVRRFCRIARRSLPAARTCTYAKTPASASPLVTGSWTHLHSVPPAGFEPAHTAPEAGRADGAASI